LLSDDAVAAFARNEFEIDMCGSGEVLVIAPANGFHRDPVVILRTKGVGQDWDEDERRQERNHIASQHRVVGAGGGYSELAAFFLGWLFISFYSI
jgi:hypothetical protein